MNQRYEYLLFDADDTLLDFKATEQEALTGLFDSLKIKLNEQIINHYHTINHSLWASFERGEISKEFIMATRFQQLFKEQGWGLPPVNIQANYQDRLAASHITIPGVFDLLDYLKVHYKLYVVSNGVASTQFRRLKDSGLFPYFDNVFVSEEVGYQKPSLAFFKYVFSHIPNFDSARALIIGDSLASDITGGINAGLDTCWFNPHHQASTPKLPMTYMIHSLSELENIL